jgi:hypothetical protein
MSGLVDTISKYKEIFSIVGSAVAVITGIAKTTSEILLEGFAKRETAYENRGTDDRASGDGCGQYSRSRGHGNGR